MPNYFLFFNDSNTVNIYFVSYLSFVWLLSHIDRQEQLYIFFYIVKMIPGSRKSQMVCTLKWIAGFFSVVLISHKNNQ